jgi:hypothetical protein
MKTNLFITTVVLTTVLLAAGAVAQTADQTAPPTTVSPAGPMPAPDQIIYIPRLPNPTELANAAAAQGLTIEMMAQTSAQITVVYKHADGQTSTVAYQLLPAAGAPAASPATTTVVPTAPATVVYATPAPAYYYDPFYWPGPWFAPVAFDIGIGYGYHYFDGGRGFRYGGGHGFRYGGGHGFRYGGGHGFRHGGFRQGSHRR